MSGLPTDGSTVYVRLTSKIGTNWVDSDYSYSATSVSGPAQITSPTPGSTFTSPTVFSWNAGSGVSQYWLYVGTTQGGNQLYDQDWGTNRSATVTGLPTNGRTIHVRLWSKIGANWPFVDYTYKAQPTPQRIHFADNVGSSRRRGLIEVQNECRAFQPSIHEDWENHAPNGRG